MRKLLCSVIIGVLWCGTAFAVDPQAKRVQTAAFDGNCVGATDVQACLDALDNLPTSSMTYPGTGIAVSTGTGWDASITDNHSNWDAAYGWGDHAGAGYLTAEVDGSTTNEIQDLALNTNTLSLSGSAATVDLSGYLDNTDDQTCAEVSGCVEGALTTETDPLSLHLLNESNDVTGGTFDLTTTGAIQGGNITAGTATTGANITATATLGPELAPALTGALWTEGTGWTVTDNVSMQHAGPTTGTISPTSAITTVAGTTYKVVITFTGTIASYPTFKFTLGGRTQFLGTVARTVTNYVTAVSNANLVITSTTSDTPVITAVSVKAMSNGDLRVDGELEVYGSGITLYGNTQEGYGATYPSIKFYNDGDANYFRLSSGNESLTMYLGTSVWQVWSSSGITTYDNIPYYFGTGADSKLVFTGTQLQLQSDRATATDSLLLRGGTNGIAFNIGATEEALLTATQLDLKSNNFTTTGTITQGGLKISTGTTIVKVSETDSTIGIYGGTSAATGAYFLVSGADRANNKGALVFYANTSSAWVGSNDHTLRFGQYDGATWTNSIVIDKDRNVQIPADSKTLSFGAAQDMKIVFTGSQGQIQSDVVGATNGLLLRGGTDGIDFNIGANEEMSLTADLLSFTAGTNIALATTTGTKIGTATNQLLGFYNATPVDQPATVADPSGGGTQDAEARAAINAIIDRLQELGLIA